MDNLSTSSDSQESAKNIPIDCSSQMPCQRDAELIAELIPYYTELSISLSSDELDWQDMAQKDWPTVIAAYYAKLKELASRIRRNHSLDPDSHESDSLLNAAYVQVTDTCNPRDFPTLGHFLSYVCTTIRNLRMQARRKQAVRSKHLKSIYDGDSRLPSAQAGQDESQLQLQLEEVCEKKDRLLCQWQGHADSVAMYHLRIEQFTDREIAELFAVGKSTVNERILAVHDYLRRGFKQEIS